LATVFLVVDLSTSEELGEDVIRTEIPPPVDR
jgi:hypothetical protein